MKIDLHNHTNYSDGILTPEELVLRAKENGVDIFALTDHDSVFGIKEALEYGEIHGVGVIPGIELSTDYKGESVHIIGLFTDGIVPKFFEDFSQEVINVRQERAILMMQRIHEIYGLNVDIDFLLATSIIITRGNMLRNLIQCNEGMSMQETAKYISNDSKAYIPSTKLHTEEGLKLLKENKAMCILAHPTLLKKIDVLELITLGFDGIEARYPNNKENDEDYYIELAKKYNILISAGSDCHGDESHADIGTSVLNEEEFLPIKKLIRYKDVSKNGDL